MSTTRKKERKKIGRYLSRSSQVNGLSYRTCKHYFFISPFDRCRCRQYSFSRNILQIFTFSLLGSNMSLVDVTNDDNDDNQSISSSTNTDEDYIPSNCHTHRTCSRHAPCNKKNHRHAFVDSTSSICRSKNNNDQPVKGDVRAVPNEEGHQQKYDGTKWRRICSELNCFTYLNGGIFHEKWLCRKHYLLHFSEDSLNVLNRFKSTMNKSRKSTLQLSNDNTK